MKKRYKKMEEGKSEEGKEREEKWIKGENEREEKGPTFVHLKGNRKRWKKKHIKVARKMLMKRKKREKGRKREEKRALPGTPNTYHHTAGNEHTNTRTHLFI